MRLSRANSYWKILVNFLSHSMITPKTKYRFCYNVFEVKHLFDVDWLDYMLRGLFFDNKKFKSNRKAEITLIFIHFFSSYVSFTHNTAYIGMDLFLHKLYLFFWSEIIVRKDTKNIWKSIFRKVIFHPLQLLFHFIVYDFKSYQNSFRIKHIITYVHMTAFTTVHFLMQNPFNNIDPKPSVHWWHVRCSMKNMIIYKRSCL